MTADDFREIALSLHGAVERAHMKHPDFRVKGKIFATLHPDERSGVVKLSPDEQAEFMHLHPKVFRAASGAWGRQGWTNVNLAVADEAAVRGAVMLAWQGVAEASRARRSPARVSGKGGRLLPKRRT